MHFVSNDILIPHFAQLLKEGKRVEFTPTGVSMRPFIEGGKDVVVLKKHPNVRVGDICLAQIPLQSRDYIYVLHRVIRLDDNNVILKGDGNLRGEECCSQDDILGTVEEIRSPRGIRKFCTRGWIWRHLHPRWFFLKVYRHTVLKLYN